jgi:hypothetical protein
MDRDSHDEHASEGKTYSLEVQGDRIEWWTRRRCAEAQRNEEDNSSSVGTTRVGLRQEKKVE